MVETSTGSWRSSMDTTAQNGFASDTTVGMDVFPANSGGICIGNPGHFTFARAHVWGRNIDARSNETFLGQLDGQSSSDAFQFAFGPI